jgi:hypothetical protein
MKTINTPCGQIVKFILNIGEGDMYSNHFNLKGEMTDLYDLYSVVIYSYE